MLLRIIWLLASLLNLAYEMTLCSLGRASGQYAPRTVWCEVFLIDDGAPALGAAHYHGIYIALEKLKIAPKRVGIQPQQPPNLSGGYLFSYDNDNTEAGDILLGPLQGWQQPFQMKCVLGNCRQLVRCGVPKFMIVTADCGRADVAEQLHLCSMQGPKEGKP
jgi:hypothetical protein